MASSPTGTFIPVGLSLTLRHRAMILWCIQIHFYIIYVLFNAELLLWVFCKRNKLNGIDARLPLYLPACMVCPLFGSLLVPSLYTAPATTRCSSCLRVPPLIHSLLICTRGSARPGAATP